MLSSASLGGVGVVSTLVCLVFLVMLECAVAHRWCIRHRCPGCGCRHHLRQWLSRWRVMARKIVESRMLCCHACELYYCVAVVVCMCKDSRDKALAAVQGRAIPLGDEGYQLDKHGQTAYSTQHTAYSILSVHVRSPSMHTSTSKSLHECSLACRPWPCDVGHEGLLVELSL